MPCSKPIRRKYSKNEVILPSDRRGSMACHAVPRVMMYQGDARVPLEAEAILRGLRWWRTEVWNNGCFVRLGRCGIVIWRLIAHYYYWAGTSGVRPPCCSALLFGAWHVDPVAICPTCRRQEVQNSWKGASTEEYTTEFMKGSDLVLEKSIFTEYVPTRVYRAHLNTFVFPFDKSQFYYTSSSTITCWISRCVRSPDASSVKRKLTNACTSSWKFSGHSCIHSN